MLQRVCKCGSNTIITAFEKNDENSKPNRNNEKPDCYDEKNQRYYPTLRIQSIVSHLRDTIQRIKSTYFHKFEKVEWWNKIGKC